MNPQGDEPRIIPKKSAELSLSKSALVEILIAVLTKGVPFRFRARGFSMTPFIKDGDVVTVSPFSDRTVCIGDIVAFIKPRSKGLAVHRVIGKKAETYQIQGDNVPRIDGFIPDSHILGIVEKVERMGKRVFLGLGPERVIIAFLARIGILLPLKVLVRKFFRPSSFSQNDTSGDIKPL